MGLSGLGDLMLTCSSAQSRNFAYGVAIGRGESLDGLPLAEGVATAAHRGPHRRASAASTRRSSRRSRRILAGEMTISEAVSALMSRPLRSETD